MFMNKGIHFQCVFFERVKAPISIDAHAWRLTGLDINRSYTVDDLSNGHKNSVLKPASTHLFMEK